MKRILVVNVNWLGDTIFVTPFIRGIRENYPRAFIAVLTHPRCKDILDGNPNIDKVILYNEKGSHINLLAKFSIVSQLKSEKFNTAFILRRSLTRAMILFLSKIPDRIGYDNKRSGFLLTKRVPLPGRGIHRVEYFLGILRGIGIEPKNLKYEFFVSEDYRKIGAELLIKLGLKQGEEFIVINPGGNWDLKRWPYKNFAELGDAIVEKFKIRIVLTGADKDIELCGNISDLMKNKPILCCGKTDLKTLGAVFEKAKWVIANDSGPMHIASALKTPVVALFGPTSHLITGPYGGGICKVLHNHHGCPIPCYKLDCEDNICMKAIKVEDVLKAMQ